MSLNRLVLVLNASYEAINITTARHALTLVFKGAAIVEEVSQQVVHTPKIDIPMPNVIRLVRYRRVPRQTRAVSRKGIMLRDAFTCAYCHIRFASSDLTLDHVIPRSRGGASTWQNLVISCKPCNCAKGDRTPQEAGLTLLKQPTQLSRHAKHRLMAGDDACWDKYLFA